MKRLRFAIRLNPTRSEVALTEDSIVSFVPMEAVGEYGGLSLDTNLPISVVANGYTYFAEDDVLVAKITPCFENGKGAVAKGLRNGIGFGTTELHVIRAGHELDHKYLFYLTISHPFRKLGEASMYGAGGQKRVPEKFILDYRAPLPDVSDQRAIAAFLDRKTAHIDMLIEKKRRLLELLEEKRLAIITQAVTKGLDPDVPMKDSGIKWLGKVPAHWETNRIKFLAAVGNGSTPKRDNPVYWVDGEYPWLNSSVVNLEEVDAPTELITRAALDECHLPIVKPPAVVIGITGEGRTRGMVSTLTIEATINQHLAFLKPTSDRMSVSYLRRVLEIAYSYLRSESDGGGSTKGAITCEQLGELVVPVPPRKEQEVISANIRQAIETMSETRKVISRAVERLKEYRSALITNAVIGKIDVRNLVGDEAAA